MVNYKQFYQLLSKIKVISPIWEYILDLIENEIKQVNDHNEYLVLFTMYFALIDEGNICMSLDKNVLHDKWSKRLLQARILLEDKDEFNEDEYNYIIDISDKCLAYAAENSDSEKFVFRHKSERIEPFLHRLSKGVCRKRRAQKSCQGDRYLDGREEF